MVDWGHFEFSDEDEEDDGMALLGTSQQPVFASTPSQPSQSTVPLQTLSQKIQEQRDAGAAPSNSNPATSVQKAPPLRSSLQVAESSESTNQSSNKMLSGFQQQQQHQVSLPPIQRRAENIMAEGHFHKGAWLCALKELQLAPYFGQRKLRFSIRYVLFEGYWKRTPYLLVVVEDIKQQDTDALVTCVDPTGTIKGSLHRHAIVAHRDSLTPGCVLFLKDVSIFSSSHTEHYLNIVRENVLHVFPVDSVIPREYNISTSEASASPETATYSRIPTKKKRPKRHRARDEVRLRAVDNRPPTAAPAQKRRNKSAKPQHETIIRPAPIEIPVPSSRDAPRSNLFSLPPPGPPNTIVAPPLQHRSLFQPQKHSFSANANSHLPESAAPTTTVPVSSTVLFARQSIGALAPKPPTAAVPPQTPQWTSENLFDDDDVNLDELMLEINIDALTRSQE